MVLTESFTREMAQASSDSVNDCRTAVDLGGVNFLKLDGQLT